jgi:hypothetical protein
VVNVSLSDFRGISGIKPAREDRVLPTTDVERKPTSRIGQAAQHIAACELLLAGIDVSWAAEGLRYDLLADTKGKFTRVQVKGTSAPQCGRYKFHVSGRSNGNGRPTRPYALSDIDLFAFVALDIKAVIFVPVSQVPEQSFTMAEDSFADQARRSLAAWRGWSESLAGTLG